MRFFFVVIFLCIIVGYNEMKLKRLFGGMVYAIDLKSISVQECWFKSNKRQGFEFCLGFFFGLW
jgi:hypothetical protein